MPRAQRGFTLVELMVALFALAIMALLSWQGLDGMARTQSLTQARADQVASLQTGLAQWQADLDALMPLPQLTALEWNGRVLRLTRRSSAGVTEGALVVAWTRRVIDGRGTWLRWQSPPLTNRGQVEEAWLKADIWSQNPGDEERRREVAIGPLDEWQIFFYRGDAWTNPLSSDAAAGPFQAMGRATGTAPVTALLPDGVRAVLTLPADHPLGGAITMDWARPTLGGGKS